jgi:hypothetical protein
MGVAGRVVLLVQGVAWLLRRPEKAVGG